MAVQSFDRSTATTQSPAAIVQVSASSDGGWDVIAIVDGRIVASRHCADWHRTERARRQLEVRLRTHPGRMATVALLLIMAASMAAPAIAQTPGAPTQESELAKPSEVGPREGLLPEPHVFGRSIEFARRVVASGDGGEVKSGFYPELSNMVTGAGWISAGTGYRHWLFGDRLFVDGSAAISWRSYKTAQARFELTNLAHSRLAIGSQVRWQDLTQVTYFGEGASALESNRSEYRMKSTNVVGYSVVRPLRQLAIEGRVGWLSRPALSAPGGTFERGNLATHAVLPDDPVFTTPRQPSYAYQELLLSLDTRDHRSYPTHGGVYRTVWTRYSDQDEGRFSFRRFEAEGAHFLPLARSHLVLAMHGWLVASGTYEFTSPRGLEHWYVARDIGTALGTTGRLAPEKGNPDAFERDRFIAGIRDGYVEFDYHGWHQELVRRRVTPDDVG